MSRDATDVKSIPSAIPATHIPENAIEFEAWLLAKFPAAVANQVRDIARVEGGAVAPNDAAPWRNALTRVIGVKEVEALLSFGRSLKSSVISEPVEVEEFVGIDFTGLLEDDDEGCDASKSSDAHK